MNITPARELTPREIAEREIAAERRETSVRKIKELLRKRIAAQTVLDNIDREIEDAEAAIAQGNLVV